MSVSAPGPPDRRAALTSAAIVGMVVVLVGFASGLGITIRPASSEPVMTMPGASPPVDSGTPAVTPAAPPAAPAAVATPTATATPAPTAAVTVTVPAPTATSTPGSPSPTVSPTGGSADCTGLLGSLLNTLTLPIIGPVVPLGTCPAASS